MRSATEARRAVIYFIAGAAWLYATPASAQTFPSKPVRYVVPFGAGGSPDIVGRLLSDRFTKLWGQQGMALT